jgi:SAM-dependent methyltransferase
MTAQTKVSAWEESHGRGDNHVFYPSDEVVRFVARHLRRRVGLDQIVDVLPGAAGMRVLDLGCGIGRSLVFGEEMGLRMYGVDLSQAAVQTARLWLARKNVEAPEQRVVAGDVRQLPWPAQHFDHALSDSVLDSMEFVIAQAGVAALAQVLKPGGYFYCNLISGDQSGLDPDFAGERIVLDAHERGTVQSYFNRNKILELVADAFTIESLKLVRHENLTRQVHQGRWHVVARRCGR